MLKTVEKVSPGIVFNSRNKNRGRKSRRKGEPELPASEVLIRQTRKIGSDDLFAIAKILKYGQEAGLKGKDITTAAELSKIFEDAVYCGIQDNHHKAAALAESGHRKLLGEKSIKNLTIPCRDGKVRCLDDIVLWYYTTHYRIASEIEETQLTEVRLGYEKIRSIEVERKLEEFEEIVNEIC
jgi:hypothetical protein